MDGAPLEPGRAADADGTVFRTVPHNIEAEQSLLGAILINNEALDRVSAFLRAEHFFEPIHARIFETAAKLIQVGKQATPITLRTYFENEEDIGDITVPQYIARLAANATSIINAGDYGQTVHDLATRRELIMVGEDLVNLAYDSPVDFPPSKQIEEAEQRLYGLAEIGKFGQGFESFNDALIEAVALAGAAYERDGGLSGIASGLTDLDRQMGGLQNSDLIILAGRPSMGKTSLATNIAFNVAKARADALAANPDLDPDDPKLSGASVGFFSLEMSSEQLATRILAEQAAVSSEKIRRGMITEDEFRRLRVTSETLSRLPLYIDQTGGITIAQLAARARRLKRQHGLGFIVVDYLQLLSGSGRTANQGRVQEITEITTGLKALAKELAVPILALSQLSRQVENREDKRPQLSDLRESGSIEQDADVVMFVYREEYYLERAQPREGSPEHLEWQARMNEVFQVAEAIVGKQRHGPVGTVKLHFEGQFTRFSDLAQDDRMPDHYG
ncbi:MAG: replicative DNA helicase [Pseudomonadota bacterium]